MIILFLQSCPVINLCEPGLRPHVVWLVSRLTITQHAVLMTQSGQSQQVTCTYRLTRESDRMGAIIARVYSLGGSREVPGGSKGWEALGCSWRRDNDILL